MVDTHAFPNSIRVLLVEDHTLVRAALRALLQRVAGIDVVAEAADGFEALRVIQKQSLDVVVMDVSMPRLNGLDATAQITKDFPQIPVLMLTMNTREDFISQALRNGAAGYLLKDATEAEFGLALQAMARGERYLSPAVTTCVLADYLQLRGGATADMEDVGGELAEPLTLRQREILQLVAEGYPTREIATILHLGVKTVETHRTQLMNRLNIHNIAGLVRYAIRTGMISAEQ